MVGAAWYLAITSVLSAIQYLGWNVDWRAASAARR